MWILDSIIFKLAVALGIGLLIGLERERRKGTGPSRSPAGIRTYAVTSLAGAVSLAIGGELLLAVTTAGAIVLTAIAYFRSRSDDPGLTSEITLILTVLLGGLSMRQPALAAGVAVALTALLASRTRMHHFVRSVLTEREVTDGLIFAGATLVVLPLLPDQAIGTLWGAQSAVDLDHRRPCDGDKRGGVYRGPYPGRSIRPCTRGPRLGLYFQHRHNRRHGSANQNNSDRSGCGGRGRGSFDAGDDHANVRRSRGHEHDRAAGDVGSAALCRSGRRRLRCGFHNQSHARDEGG